MIDNSGKTCKIVETDDVCKVEKSGKTPRCSLCNKPLKRNIVTSWSGIQFCYRCGAKVIDDD